MRSLLRLSTGRKVESVKRYGIHMQPTVLVVSFNEALDPASAMNLRNYRITGPAGRSVRIRSAVFDAATNTVTLRPADRINLHHTYHLTLVGVGPDGIRNTQGELLDGADTGSRTAITRAPSLGETSSSRRRKSRNTFTRA